MKLILPVILALFLCGGAAAGTYSTQVFTFAGLNYWYPAICSHLDNGSGAQGESCSGGYSAGLVNPSTYYKGWDDATNTLYQGQFTFGYSADASVAADGSLHVTASSALGGPGDTIPVGLDVNCFQCRSASGSIANVSAKADWDDEGTVLGPLGYSGPLYVQFSFSVDGSSARGGSSADVSYATATAPVGTYPYMGLYNTLWTSTDAYLAVFRNGGSSPLGYAYQNLALPQNVNSMSLNNTLSTPLMQVYVGDTIDLHFQLGVFLTEQCAGTSGSVRFCYNSEDYQYGTTARVTGMYFYSSSTGGTPLAGFSLSSNLQYPGLDSSSSTPEPAVPLLLSAGLAAIAFLRRRKT